MIRDIWTKFSMQINDVIILFKTTLPVDSFKYTGAYIPWLSFWHHYVAVITNTGCIADGVGRVFSRVCLSVCLFVCALKRKRLELSTPNLIHIYSIVIARHVVTQRSEDQRSRSHGYENRHGRTVASDACCYGRVLLLPAWVCMSIRLPMFSCL